MSNEDKVIIKKQYDVRIRDLIDAGFISPGDVLVHKLRKENRIIKSKILGDGRLEVQNGIIKKTLTDAAFFYLKQSTNGWRFWYLLKNNEKTSMLKIRRQYIERHT